jgi:hypothetical protein
MRSVVASGYHYIWHEAGIEELYDFSGDPDELRNIADTAQGRQTIAELRRVLERAVPRPGH